MNDRIFIEGGHKLKGNVQITGLQKCSAAYDGGFSFTPGSERTERLSENCGCILHGRNPAESGGCNLVGGPRSVSGLHQSGQNRGPIFLHRENAVFCDPSGGTSWKK